MVLAGEGVGLVEDGAFHGDGHNLGAFSAQGTASLAFRASMALLGLLVERKECVGNELLVELSRGCCEFFRIHLPERFGSLTHRSVPAVTCNS